MKLPAKKKPGDPVLAADWNTLLDAITARTPRPSLGMELVFTPGGFLYRVRPQGAASSHVPGEPFAEIITYMDGEVAKTAIRGGVVYAGDQVWNVDPQELNLDADGTYKVWLEVGVTANMEDDVLMPGIDTSEAPTWEKVSADGGQYPDQTAPTVDEPTGTAVIAIGTLTIKDKSATLMPAGYGSIRIDFCPSVLSHTRV